MKKKFFTNLWLTFHSWSPHLFFISLQEKQPVSYFHAGTNSLFLHIFLIIPSMRITADILINPAPCTQHNLHNNNYDQSVFPVPVHSTSLSNARIRYSKQIISRITILPSDLFVIDFNIRYLL